VQREQRRARGGRPDPRPLETARDLWRSLPEEAEADRMAAARATFRLIHLADILAVTTPA
jgi:hypothetical protein